MAAKTPEVPSPAVLKAVARAELRSLRLSLGKTKPGQSVHGARRQIKRMRSLMRLLRGPMGEEHFATANSALREAADALAGQRRAEALVVAAGRLGGGRGAKAAWLQLAESHREAHVADSAADGGLEAAGNAIDGARRTLAALRLKPDPGAILESFVSAYRKARKLLGRGLKSGDAEELHTARKYVIHHLHHLDLLRAHLPASAKRLKALEKLRETLGDLNDLDELNQLAADARKPLAEPAAKALAKRRASLLKQAQKSSTRLFRLKPKSFRKRIGAIWKTAQY